MRLCRTGKAPYLDRASAVRALDEQRSVPREWHAQGRPPARPYRCPDCGFYHLTKHARPPRLLQQVLLSEDPTGWRMLVGCVLLNRTARWQVDEIRAELFRRWPTATRMARADQRELEDVVRKLGFGTRRARRLIEFSAWWAEHTDRRGERVLAMEPPGVGAYARDSWVIFKMKRRPDWAVTDPKLREWLAALGPPAS